MYTSELLPTVIRCTVFGTLNGTAQLGAIIGNQVLKLNTNEMPWISGIVFGIITLIAAGLLITLPESYNLPLTQTLDEAEFLFTRMENTHTHKTEYIQNTKPTSLLNEKNNIKIIRPSSAIDVQT